jgi:predicted TIM-barrel fold metal-dependent hydrolase
MAMRCDCHVHVVGPAATFPQVPGRSVAAPAPLARLRDEAAARGIDRFVIVQPSFYGADNTVLMESLAMLGDHGRGVVVIDPARPVPPDFDGGTAWRVRGLRLNLYSPTGGRERPMGAVFADMAKAAGAMGWHVEVIAPLAMLVEAAQVFARAAMPVVIDHYGVYGDAAPTHAAARQFLDLLKQPHVWVKLSAPYRVGTDPLNTKPDADWLAAILGVAAPRCVWGSDWPHTPPHELRPDGKAQTGYRPLSYPQLVDDFTAALASAELADRILADNPSRLYGF